MIPKSELLVFVVHLKDHICSCLHIRASIQPASWSSSKNGRRAFQTLGELTYISTQITLTLCRRANDHSLCVQIVDSVIALFRVDFTGRGELADRQVWLLEYTITTFVY